MPALLSWQNCMVEAIRECFLRRGQNWKNYRLQNTLRARTDATLALNWTPRGKTGKRAPPCMVTGRNLAAENGTLAVREIAFNIDSKSSKDQLVII